LIAKLYAKVIGERLWMICKTVIGPEQLAFVEKGLSMRGTSSSTKYLNYLEKRKLRGEWLVLTLRVLLILLAMSLFGSYCKKWEWGKT
jgi:hypothetical protein